MLSSDAVGTTQDLHGRPLRSLRISVTDRCNLRCAYCMPEREYAWLERADLLSFEEIAELVDAFTDIGVRKVRLTGGEPLLRRDLESLVALLAARAGLRELAMTTNGVRLAGRAAALRRAGLTGLTISLDTLRPEVFRELAQRDELPAVLAGIEDARAAGFESLKLDTVLLRGTNDGEIGELLDFARQGGLELRFIEYMDVGGATRWRPEHVVGQAELLERIAGLRGRPEALPGRGSAPAQRFRLPDGQVFGVIASTTTPFCGTCDRARLTADGLLYLCLYARIGLDLRGLLRAGATRTQLAERLARTWSARDDRGAERRMAEAVRTASLDVGALRADPHLEMHTRGG
jgi:cyclic pyranopterin phosphate synthase